MMASPEALSEGGDAKEGWEPEAWVYFIWIVLGYQVYCKIGYSTHPASRYRQLITGIPERPYRIHLLPCLTVEQARLFERMFHQHMQDYQSRGEWFTHVNARHLHKALRSKMQEIVTLFRIFGYRANLEKVELDGDRPVFHPSGIVSHIIRPAGLDDS